MSQNIASFNLSDAELEFVKAGVADGAKGKTPKFDPQQYFPKLQEMQKTRQCGGHQSGSGQGCGGERREAHRVGPGHHDDQGRQGRGAESRPIP